MTERHDEVYPLYARPVADVPCLIMEPHRPLERAPDVLVLHGLRGGKERMLPTVYAFARAGFRAIALDCRMHNGREGSDELDRMLECDYVRTMRTILTGTAADISAVLDSLQISSAAIHGLSMGGYVVFTAMITEPRLVVATVAMGSPDWLTPLPGLGYGPETSEYQEIAQSQPLALGPAAYPPRALLMLHGDQDDVVPIGGVENMYRKLAPAYADRPERLSIHIYPGAAHHYLDDMVARSVAFTRQFCPLLWELSE